MGAPQPGIQGNPGLAARQVQRAGVGGAASPVRARRLTDEIRGQTDPINRQSPLVNTARLDPTNQLGFGAAPPTETAQGDVVPSSVTERATNTVSQRRGRGRQRAPDINSAGFQAFGNTLLGRGVGGGQTLLGR